MKSYMKTGYIICGAIFGFMGILLAFCCVYGEYSGVYTVGTDAKLCGSVYLVEALLVSALYDIRSLQDEVSKLKERVDNESCI